ncbi:hypothetical protein [Oryza sativa Japonica Group]|uniref:Uncharacterized protein n=1 Tax=Oryza sativa subsp. japonica TaxID=39947 RepID=Q5Z8E1_ORYSJ|nr:hypothetical protein [Oryza sativa Japonica Group]
MAQPVALAASRLQGPMRFAFDLGDRGCVGGSSWPASAPVGSGNDDDGGVPPWRWTTGAADSGSSDGGGGECSDKAIEAAGRVVVMGGGDGVGQRWGLVFCPFLCRQWRGLAASKSDRG